MQLKPLSEREIEVGNVSGPQALDLWRHLGAVQAKWDRLTARDYAVIKSVDELVAAVEARYSLSHGDARADVESWMRVVRP